jgi:hypothetical protein
LYEPHRTVPAFVELEDVVAVEDAGLTEVPEPGEFPAGLDRLDGGRERELRVAARLDLDLELGPDLELPADAGDEGVPVGIGGEVGQDPPDLLPLGIDHDFAPEVALERIRFGRRGARHPGQKEQGEDDEPLHAGGPRQPHLLPHVRPRRTRR